MTTPDFRCSAASAADGEPLAGSAPTETEWLLVEHAGPWAAKAVAELGVDGPPGVRVQLVRRHGGGADTEEGLRVFRVSLGARPAVRTAVAPGLHAIGAAVGAGVEGLEWTAYDGHLWLVCTNGRRDRCCAELGRPVAGALAERWPEETWETTHLGGHRFAGTLLALPSGVVLGRLDPDSAVSACTALAAGELPARWSRGRAGLPGRAQVAELHLRHELRLDGLDAVHVEEVADAAVVLRAAGERWSVEVAEGRGEPRRQSCADQGTKPAPTYADVRRRPSVAARRGVRRGHTTHRTRRSAMTSTPEEPLSDEDMTTVPAGDPTQGIGDSDGTDSDGTDSDASDGDATDTTDGDSSDSDGTDSDGTDS